jgi:hypothetical protein
MARPTEVIAQIKEEHLPGVRGDFNEILRARIKRRRGTNSPASQDMARFFEYLLDQVDTAEYRNIQEKFQEKPDGKTKYLDPIMWFESKLRIALSLELDTKPPLRILDLGTGPGHFPVVGRFYGHDVTGSDLPSSVRNRDESGDLYDALCSVYRVKRIELAIRPACPLGDVGGPYDMVTAFLAAFNLDERKQPWGISEWQFFLNDLHENVLAEHGVLFMSLARDKLTRESWDYLVSRSQRADERWRTVLISDFANGRP